MSNYQYHRYVQYPSWINIECTSDNDCYFLNYVITNKNLLSSWYTGIGNSGGGLVSRPMQRKLVTLLGCQLVEPEGRARALRAARSLGERTVTELILQHQNPQQLSANLWAAVRARGCQFLGPGTIICRTNHALIKLVDLNKSCSFPQLRNIRVKDLKS